MALKTTQVNDVRKAPAYSVAEAAHYLRMPEETLRSWVVGRIYPVFGKSKRSRSLITLDDPGRRYLSFINLVEAHVLAEVMKEILGIYLKRIEWDAQGLPIKLYPFIRDTDVPAAPVSDPRVVVMSPSVSFGRPVIAGTGITVSSIYERYRAGDSVADLARDLRLESGAIEEAIRCEAA